MLFIEETILYVPKISCESSGLPGKGIPDSMIFFASDISNFVPSI